MQLKLILTIKIDLIITIKTINILFKETIRLNVIQQLIVQ